MMDLVTVYHNAVNREQAYELADMIHDYADAFYVLWFGNNTLENIGFGRRCNIEAAHGTAEVIGFINPDAIVSGPFMKRVFDEFDRDEDLVITGERFGKTAREIRTWGLTDWVCGAAFFVRRSWWEEVGGFHDGYVWGWEETDLCRTAEANGKRVRSIHLPIHHVSPSINPPRDVAYKHKHFEDGARLFRQRWR